MYFAIYEYIATVLQFTISPPRLQSMNTIIDYGKKGAEHLKEFTEPVIQKVDPLLYRQVEIIKQFPKTTLVDETSDGKRESINAHVLTLSNPHVFKLLHAFSAYQPLVYIGQADRPASMGILSPNYDDHGHERNPDLKVIPLFTPYPLRAKGNHFVPDARMMTMLAGAASAESKGVGSHGDINKDFEHRATILGGISIGNPNVAINHNNHAVRQGDGSVASSLTNGQLGNLYAPNQSENDFTGFGQPIVVKSGATQPTDIIYIPESFLESFEAYGVTYDQAPQIMLGAGLKALHSRQPDNSTGRSTISDQIKIISEKVKANTH